MRADSDILGSGWNDGTISSIGSRPCNQDIALSYVRFMHLLENSPINELNIISIYITAPDVLSTPELRAGTSGSVFADKFCRLYDLKKQAV